ncbi:MAG: Beta-lactamase [Xanthobacteraceae bacterium]|nr:Beta-lactamase [Xanthobacteraceae bacterium]
MTQLNRRHLLSAAALAGAAGALAPLVGTTPALAAAPPVGKQAAGWYRYKIGDMEVTVVTDGARPGPLADNFVANAKKEDVNKALEAAFMEKDKVTIPFNPVVVNTGGKLIAIDTGLGAAVNAQSKGAMGQYHTNLTAAGLDAKNVDMVIISHFHGDHIGGLINAEGKPAFANAEILVPSAEWAYWTDEGNASRAPEGLKGNFALVKKVFDAHGNKVTKYEGGKELAPGITSMSTFGHTPGHTSHVLSSGKSTVMLQADVTNVPYLFARHPGWHAVFDMDGKMAEETRRKLYDQLAADRMMVQAYHYPFPSVAHVEKDGNGYRTTPAPWSPSI